MTYNKFVPVTPVNTIPQEVIFETESSGIKPDLYQYRAESKSDPGSGPNPQGYENIPGKELSTILVVVEPLQYNNIRHNT